MILNFKNVTNWFYFFRLFELRHAPPPFPPPSLLPCCSDRTNSLDQLQSKNGKQCGLFSFPQTTMADLFPLSDISQSFFSLSNICRGRQQQVHTKGICSFTFPLLSFCFSLLFCILTFCVSDFL